jgi:hypothetical protein
MPSLSDLLETLRRLLVGEPAPVPVPVPVRVRDGRR